MNNIKLEEAFEFIRNGASIKQYDGALGHPITRIETIANGYVDENRMGYADIFEIDKYKEYILQKGDILMSHINSEKHLGKCAIFQGERDDIIHGMNLLGLRCNMEILTPRFAFYCLSDEGFKRQLPRITKKSVNQASFAVSDLRKLTINVPSIEKQDKIVQILDKAQELIDNRKEQIEACDELVKSKFIEMFGDINKNEKGWEQGKLKKYADILTGYPFKSEKYSSDNTHIKICGGLIIMPNGIEWDKCNFWNNKEVDGLDKYFLDINDIVLAMDRPWISSGLKIALIKEQELPTLLIQRTARIRGVGINQYFLYYLLKNENFKVHCKPTETTVPHIAIGDIKEYLIPIPPIELQNQFADFVKQVDKLKFEMEQSLKELEDNFNSLMQRAFKGELFN